VKLHIRINPSSGQPFYRQIADQVKADFLRGFLEAGEQLPSVRELAAELAMNPTTIVKAYDLLENERLIVRRQGKGAFVADGKQPMHAKERAQILRELAARLALEGRRLGLEEHDIEALLQAELKKLRPGPSRAQRKKTKR